MVDLFLTGGETSVEQARAGRANFRAWRKSQRRSRRNREPLLFRAQVASTIAVDEWTRSSTRERTVRIRIDIRIEIK